MRGKFRTDILIRRRLTRKVLSGHSPFCRHAPTYLLTNALLSAWQKNDKRFFVHVRFRAVRGKFRTDILIRRRLTRNVLSGHSPIRRHAPAYLLTNVLLSAWQKNDKRFFVHVCSAIFSSAKFNVSMRSILCSILCRTPRECAAAKCKKSELGKNIYYSICVMRGIREKKIFFEKDTQKSDTDEMQIKSISSASPVIFICGKTKSLPYSLTGKRYFRQLILYNPPVFFPQVRNSTKSP